MKTLGIIGGMGPEATIDLFRKIVELTDAKRDQDHIHIIIDNYPQIPDRTAYLTGKGEDPSDYIRHSAERLETAGADALLMPCNTAHYFAPVITRAVKIPLISIVESAVAEIKAKYPSAQNILPIATIGTKTGRVYENVLLREGYSLVEMPEDIQADVMYAIYEGVKKGQTQAVLTLFKKTLHRIETELKPDVMIAACTEIPILMEHISPNVPTVDATMALARAAVAFAKD